MAQKRMFSKDVVRTDRFLDMPLSAQALYFHLNLDADVKGFVSPRSIMRLINSNNDDLNVLITKGFAIPFDDGIILITHWNVNNIVREDREATSQFMEKLESVLLVDSGTYQLLDNSGSTPAQIRLDKIRLDEVRLGESKDAHTTFKEVESFLEEIASKYEVPLEFVQNSYDTAGNWIKAKGRVYKDYRAFFENWVKRDKADWLLKVRKQHNGVKIAHYQE